MKEVNAPNCGQENELIAFLYGELNDVEARTFQRHLHDCAGCEAELAAFKGVRESVVAWRNESLGGLISTAGSNTSAVMAVAHREPSALAAVREFFSLSPLWMKGALAFASVLFILFGGLAIARLRETPPLASVTNQESNANAEEQLKARVAQLQDELQRMKNSAAPAPVSPVVAKKDESRTPAPRGMKRDNEFAGTVLTQKSRRPLSKTEREQLAADLRLTSAKNDSDLDLLGDRINQ
jgi:hypothetical protein